MLEGFLTTYDLASDGIQIKGDNSYHVAHEADTDVWYLIRRRDGVIYSAAVFNSGDEARAYAQAMDLTIGRV